MKKRFMIVSLLLILCWTSVAMAETSAYELPGEVKIGVIGYDFTSGINRAYRDYLLMLSDSIEGLSFEFATTQTNDDAHIAAVDGLLTRGVDGIITVFDGAIETILNECQDAGAFLVIYPGYMTEDAYDRVKNHPAFLGVVVDGYYDGGVLGAKIAQYVASLDGLDRIGITSFPSAIMKQQGEIDAAFRETMLQLEPSVEIYDTHQHFFDGSGIDMYVGSHAGRMDLLLGLGAAFENDYPIIANMGMLGTVKLAAMGLVFSDEIAAEFEAGNVIFGNVSPVESAGTAAALVINTVLGQPYADMPHDAPILDTGTVMVTSGEEYRAFVNDTFVGGGAPMITVDEFVELLTHFNPEATLQQLAELNASFSLEKAIMAVNR